MPLPLVHCLLALSNDHLEREASEDVKECFCLSFVVVAFGELLVVLDGSCELGLMSSGRSELDLAGQERCVALRLNYVLWNSLFVVNVCNCWDN